MNKTDESTERKTTSTSDVNTVSTQTDPVEAGQEQTGRGCSCSKIEYKYYERDDEVIAVSYVCSKHGETFLYGEQALRDWTENAD